MTPLWRLIYRFVWRDANLQKSRFKRAGDKPREWGEVSFLIVLNAFMNPLRGLALCVVHAVTIMFPLRGNLKIYTKHRRCFNIVTMHLVPCCPILVEDQQIFRGRRGFVLNCSFGNPSPRADQILHFVPIKNIGISFILRRVPTKNVGTCSG